MKSGKRLPKGHTLTEAATPYPYVRLVDIKHRRISGAGIKFLRPETYCRISQYVINTDDVVLAIVGHTIGLVGYVDATWSGANLTENAAKLTTAEGVLPKYLFYYLTSETGLHQIRSRVVGTAQGKLPLNQIRSMPITVPPLPEQRAIASVMTRLDEKIELLRQMNTTLEAIGRTIYNSWFEEFEPVHINRQGRTASRGSNGRDANSSAFPAELADLFPSAFQDSAIGKIPMGWEVLSNGELMDFENGDRGKNYPRASDFVSNGIPFINAGNLVEGGIDLGRVSHISESKFESLRAGKVRPGDLLYCLRGSPGRIARAGSLATGAIASSLVIIRPTHRSCTNFIYYALAGERGQRMVAALNNGSAQPNVSVRALSCYPALAPPLKVQEAFEARVQPLFARIESNYREAMKLREIRDTLLPRLLSGEQPITKALLRATSAASGGS